jgi:catechol-2,3-dioxygenase
MKFLEVTLPATRLEALSAFYGHRLGLPVEHVGGTLCVQVGLSRLRFSLSTDAHAPVHLAFNVPEHQFAEAKAWLSERCALTRGTSGNDEFFFEGWNAHAVYFVDPDANILELIARHTLPPPLQVDGAFGAHSLLDISEVGIVTDDVRATAQLAWDRLGAPIYKNAPNDQFMPVGDEHGLLIIVAQGRPWFAHEAQRAMPVQTTLSIEGAPDFALTPHAHIIGSA